MIEKLQIKNFKSLKDIDLELDKINVLIGPNAGGKSNIIDAFKLLSEAASGHLQDAIASRGGINSIVYGGTPDLMAFSLNINRNQSKYSYYILLNPHFFFPYIQEEVIIRDEKFSALTFKKSQAEIFDHISGKSESRNLKASELAISQLIDAFRYQDADFIRFLLYWIHFYTNWNIGKDSLARNPSAVKQEFTVDEHGLNLASVLHNICNKPEYNDQYEEIIHMMRLAYPGFKKFNFLADAGEGKIALRWEEEAFPRKDFSIRVASDGMIKFIFLATILMNPLPPPLICFEEPEIGLHPAAMELVASMIKDASDRTQLIVTTHSPQFVNFFAPEDIVVVEKEEGATKATRLDPKELELWLDEFKLGDLWLSGEIGGRP